MRLATRVAFAVFLLLASVSAGGAQAQTSGPGASPFLGQPGLPQRPLRDAAIRQTGTARIRGRVIAVETGAPLRRVQVRAFSPESRDSRLTSTDAEGRYELKELPGGRYTVSATKAGYVTLQYGQRRAFEPGKPIELADGQIIERVDFVLPRGSVVTGRLVDEFGEPVADAGVQALRYQYFGGRRRLVPAGRGDQTNDIGQYRIYGLPPGEYVISAVVRGGLFIEGESNDTSGYAPTYYPGTLDPTDAQRVALGVAQEITNADFALIPTRTVRISGSVADSQGRPVGDAFVTLMPGRRAAGMRFFMARGGGRVRPDGTFTLPGVAPGDYTLQVRTAGGGSDGEREFATLPLTVAGEDVTGLAIVTTRGGAMAGQVVIEPALQPNFQPRTLRISVVPAEYEFDGGLTASPGRVLDDWTFIVKGLSFERYLIRASGLPADWAMKAVLLDGFDVTDTGVEIKSADELGGFQVVLTSRTTEVSGSVTDDRNQPAKDYAVIVFADDSSRWGAQSRFVRMLRPDQEGRFRARGLPPETYVAVAAEYVPEGEWNDPAFLERIRASGTRFALAEGETRTVTLKMTALPQ